MKKLFTLCAALAATMQLQAQTANHPKAKPDMQRISNAIMQKQLQGGALKTTATAKRIKSTAWHGAWQGELTDSIIHYYRNYKGSNLPFEDAYFSNTSISRAPFNPSDARSVQFIMSDSSVTYSKSGSGLKVLSKHINDYNSTGLILARHENYDKGYEYAIKNNSFGQRETVMDRDSTGTGIYTDVAKHHFIYNANGQILKDSVTDPATGDPFMKTAFLYDGAGNLSTVTRSYGGPGYWEPHHKMEMAYDANNRVVSMYSYYEDGNGNWDSTGRAIYEYAGAAQQYVYTETAFYNSMNGWEPDYGERITLNSNNGIGEKYHLNYFLNGDEDTTDRTDYEYNTSNLIDKMRSYRYYGDGDYGVPDTIYFHYEDYETEGINNVAANNAALSIYPNPASNVLNVRFDAALKPTGYTIVDLTGRVVARQPYTADNMVDVSALPAGTYVLTANGTNQHRQFVIVR